MMENKISRRSFLAATAGMALSAAARPALAARKTPVGVQLWCVRKELATEMPQTLAALAEMGYQGVEFADYFQKSARELRALLDTNGLKACGTHIFLDDMLGDKLYKTVEFNQELGNKYLIIRFLPENYRNSKDAFMKTIDLINKASDNLKPYGMRVGYHNHDYIFDKFEGETMWDLLGKHANKNVVLQLDTGNASVVGVDVLDVLKRNKGRAATIHLKPFSRSNEKAYIGEDELDWKQILNVVDKTGKVEWYIIEYEVEGIPPLEALKANLEAYRRLRA